MATPPPSGEWNNLTKYKHFQRRAWTIKHSKCTHDYWICRCSQCGTALASEFNHPLMSGRTEDFISFLERRGYKIEAPKNIKEVEIYIDKPHFKITNRIDRVGQSRRLRVYKDKDLFNFDLEDNNLKEKNPNK